VNGAAAPYVIRDGAIAVGIQLPRGDSATFEVSYRSQGLDQWRYILGNDVAEVRDFHLVMKTDFEDIDYPGNTLAPGSRTADGDGWQLEWRYESLLSGFQIGMDMPKRLQPGPIAGEISYFAPISLLFFFAAVFLIVTIRGIDLHPVNYAFLAGGFFAFHLLLAYLVDHISIHLAFAVASVVSIGLVVSYLRLAVGIRFATREAALAQLVYLVLFSYAFFFEGFTGLAITIGSVLTLFVAMQLTGRIDWTRVFAGEPGAVRVRTEGQ
jgi:inner membrane protein involved in colicin E2 resistance